METFPALAELPGCRHGFVPRIPGIDVDAGKAAALGRLDAVHRAAQAELRLEGKRLVTAEQVHGVHVQPVDEYSPAQIAGADGLVTNSEYVCLGIYVADCCAVFLVDPTNRCIGLVHSGKRGTEQEIVPAALRAMSDSYGSDPQNVIVQLSPCIRPPRYEIDFARQIARQCKASGVREIHDSGVCTAANVDRYYSYRAEKGRTGRMLALLGLVDLK